MYTLFDTVESGRTSYFDAFLGPQPHMAQVTSVLRRTDGELKKIGDAGSAFGWTFTEYNSKCFEKRAEQPADIQLPDQLSSQYLTKNRPFSDEEIILWRW